MCTYPGTTENQLGQRLWPLSPLPNLQEELPGPVKLGQPCLAWSWLGLIMCLPSKTSSAAVRISECSQSVASRPSQPLLTRGSWQESAAPLTLPLLAHRTPQQTLCGEAKGTDDPEGNAQRPGTSCPLPGNRGRGLGANSIQRPCLA